ncbi:hypothetical protein SEA_JABBERWOCKY_65 [Gordonia phage Jabberwocky]|uniref:Uncharacterized protein n=2 Tax=Vividuovirus TaxID=2560251 RepID=A0A5P8D7S5_9CAUD|nr:hypothetical protein KNU76_gp65 [Gordonia phage Jabberwocky]QFP94120.1 hypothetical protein SEA_JABBERWOCKY_65 [Gordonia phage Jabberwocky]
MITRAMQRNALRALGIEPDGTIASVTITTTKVVVARVHAESESSWTDVYDVATPPKVPPT